MSYQEKMEAPPTDFTSKHSRQKGYIAYCMKFLFFINDTVEENSTILFLNYTTYFMLGRPVLYPHIKCEMIQYTNDQDLLQYLRENPIQYIILSEGLFPLSSNTTLFTKIQYDSNRIILKINRDAL